MSLYLTTAFLIGFLGSFHCAGMCGPIAFTLPLGNKPWAGRVFGSLAYNAGRTIIYMVMGSLIGFLGMGISMAGFQEWASIIAGAAMILLAGIPLLFKKERKTGGIFTKVLGTLQSRLVPLLRNGSIGSLFAIGLLNGLLPCGLVYVSLAGALNAGGVIPALLFMAAFGIGTIPMMFAVSLAGSFISLNIRSFINRATPYVIIFLGVLFIVRGLSLGIPYLSPKHEALTPVVEQAHSCCKKK